MKKPRYSDHFLSLKRLIRAARRRRKDNSPSGASNSTDSDRIPYHSEILTLLRSAIRAPNPRSQKVFHCILPRVFSITEDPLPSLRAIYAFINETRCARPPREIYFNHASVQSIDLAAECVLDYSVIEYEKENRRRRHAPIIGGRLPDDSNLQKFIRAVGLIKNIGAKHEFLTREESRDLRIFTMRNRKAYSALSIGCSDYKERTVAEFVQHIDECLMANNRELTPDGRARLAEYTGEILANAEDHSGLNDWSIAGYLDNGHIDHICEIAVFNFGRSLSETFLRLDSDSYTRRQVQPYVDLHSKRGFFSAQWTQRDLFTLVALQGNVSTKNASKNDTRGQGTVEMIHFFQQVHEECVQDASSTARMAILSGSTFILFDGTYKMRPDDAGRHVIAFNAENDLELPPDPKYVRGLGGISFPGTIISIRFPLSMSESRQTR